MSPLKAKDINTLIREIQRPRILVLGDLMLDEFIWGNVHRISPEAPVPVVKVSSESSFPGGSKYRASHPFPAVRLTLPEILPSLGERLLLAA